MVELARNGEDLGTLAAQAHPPKRGLADLQTEDRFSLTLSVSTRPYERAATRVPSLTLTIERRGNDNLFILKSKDGKTSTGRFWAAFSRRQAQGPLMRLLFDAGWAMRSTVSRRASRRASQGK